MNTYYKSWLETETKWIGQYKRTMLWKSFSQTIPAELLILGILFGVFGYLNGGGLAGVLTGIFSGLVTGIFIGVFYFLYLAAGLRTGKYLSMIKAAADMLNMDENEKEQLGHEMLETETRPWRKISFVMSGPGSNNTPAQFKVTPHYAYLEGGAPYVILVRLSDVVRIEPGQEEKSTVKRGGKTKRIQKFTLYTIGFHCSSDAEEKKLPDQAMGFFSREIRDQALDLLKRNAKDLD